MRLFLLGFLLACTGLVNAQAYRWVDENGVTHYSDTPPAQQQEEDTVERRRVRDEATGVRPRFDNRRSNRSAGANFSDRDAMSGSARDVDCHRAVDNFNRMLDDAEAMGATRANAAEGISELEAQKRQHDLRRMRREVTVNKCEVARGKDRQGFACLDDEYNLMLMGMCIAVLE